uniref:Uncharacterized protein n=1 Tax=Podoviridae sp. ct8Lf7 TaxID=2827723 RepID=A0A8S5S0U5_9CAUD|nr:MAG TPA: hypothetical protein [Podoviridae sp. ct8Lf7]
MLRPFFDHRTVLKNPNSLWIPTKLFLFKLPL